MKVVKKEDLRAVQEYIDGEAQNLLDMWSTGYADGLQEMLDWLNGDGPRPGSEEK